MIEKIPTLVTVAVLSGIFACLERHVRTVRSRFWKIGWFLVFVHFLAQLFEPHEGTVNPLLASLDWAALQASAIAFLVAVASIAEERSKRILLLSITGVPSVGYAVLGSYDVKVNWPYMVCLSTCFLGGILFLFWSQESTSPQTIALASILALAGFWTIRSAQYGWFDPGGNLLLGLGFAISGLLMWRNYWRPSPGVLIVAIGFLFWGAVFPVGMLTDHFLPHVHIPEEIWNIPKMFVAFGMVLTIVEDMRFREHAKNVEMQRFSSITSQLLGGAKVDSLCGEVAAAVTEVSNFRVAVVHLGDAGRSLRVAGSSGLPSILIHKMQEEAQHWTTQDVEDACARGTMIGHNSFVPATDDATGYIPLRSLLKTHQNHQILIPMRSAQGGCLGCIALGEPQDVTDVNACQLVRIELLVADLAVALELKSLQGQLARSERLAALGQLVAGVAHELNNPLTAVMGYGELLADETFGESARTRLEKLLKESRRMKRIIDNLLHFSRQGQAVAAFVDLGDVIREVLALHEYCTRTRNFEKIVEIQPGLRPVSFDEDQIKQILLNLLSNASDAVQSAADAKRVVLRAFERDGMAIIEVEDTGPGFADVTRAFDPFYTTKPVGKGTGLGLSICYGMVKKNGGEIYAENRPTGARVSVKLPFANPIELSSVFPTALSSASSYYDQLKATNS